MKLEDIIITFQKHKAIIVYHYQTIKSVEENFNEKEAVIHMDFSEKFNTKYSEEVQVFHFDCTYVIKFAHYSLI